MASGIGMQVVDSVDEFESALNLCQGRALSAFGDDRVFLEKFIEGLNVEFQVLGDGEDAIHFGERFCSIQRRHQKSWKKALGFLMRLEPI